MNNLINQFIDNKLEIKKDHRNERRPPSASQCAPSPLLLYNIITPFISHIQLVLFFLYI